MAKTPTLVTISVTMFLSKRGTIWYLYYHADGKRQKVSTGTGNRGEAYEFLRTFIPKERSSVSTPPHRFFERFIEWARPRFAEATINRYYLPTWNAFMTMFSSLENVGEITQEMAERFMTSRYQVSHATARVSYNVLSKILSKACKWELLKANPMKAISRPKAGRGLPAYISHETAEALVGEGAPNIPAFRRAVLLSLYAGLRLGEVLALRWEDVNLKEGWIKVYSTKTKKDRIVPIPDMLRNQLVKIHQKAILLKHGPYVLGGTYSPSYISHLFKRTCRKIGVAEGVHFHSLRHTYASWLVQRGVSVYAVKDLLGHASVSTTEIYAHLHRDSLREAVSVLDQPPQDQNRRNRTPSSSRRDRPSNIPS